MAVYVDNAFIPWRRGIWSHLMADDLEELHEFAEQLGLRREWFQEKSIPHYDVTKSKRLQAIAQGAIAEDISSDHMKAFRREAMRKDRMSKWLGVVGIDAGMTSGYVQGVVPMAGSIQHKVKRMKLRKALHVSARGVNGGSPELGAALQLYSLINNFRIELDAKNVPLVIVIEDFTLRGPPGSTARSGLSSARIASSLEAFCWIGSDQGMEWLAMPWYISASVSKSTVNKDRLKRWGLWETGMEHARDAWRLWATYVRSRQTGEKVTTLATGHKVFKA